MWQPEEESLKLLADLLNQSQSPDNEKQKEVFRKTNELAENPEFVNYLVYILSIKGDSSINTLRQIAGSTLKGVLERNFDKLQSQNLEYVKLKLLETFDDETSFIRRTVSNVITALFTVLGYKNWPEIIKFLSENLQKDDADIVETTLDCVSKILEDIRTNSENIEFFDDDPLNQLIPRLIQLCNPVLPWKIKALAIYILNLFSFAMPPIFLANMNNYFEILFISSQDQNALVRQRACEGFLEVLERRKDLITANLDKVLERVVAFTMDSDNAVAKVACRFWNEFLILEQDEPYDRIEALKKYLHILVPALIENLRYTEEDLMNMDTSGANTENVFHKDTEDEEEGITEIPEEEEEKNLFSQGEWTLRREAGNSLDLLARFFGDEVFFKGQEKILTCLQSENWMVRESGILALGALALGSYLTISAHFDDIYPFLMKNLNDEHPLIRSISCWTLSRFTNWFCSKYQERPDLLKDYFSEVLKKMLDPSTPVQEAACSAVSKVTLKEPFFVESYILDVMAILKEVVGLYQKKSVAYMYDVIASVAHNCAREKVQDPQVQEVMMKILVHKWEISTFDNYESVTLLECTDTVIDALEGHMINYAEFFLPKTLFLIANYITARKNDDKKTLYQKKEVAARCFELLGTFLKGVKEDAAKWIFTNDYLQLFNECIVDPDLTLKQCILSSCGEIAKNCPSILKGCFTQIAPHLYDHLVLTSEQYGPGQMIMACCNNSAWALGELAMAYPDEVAPAVGEFTTKICQLLNGNEKLHKILAQNLCICLGRLGLVNAPVVAQHLESFLKQFCLALDKVRDDPEKLQAFRGLFRVIAENPNGIVKHFHFLCHMLVNFEGSDEDLQKLAANLVVNFKNIAGNHWSGYFNAFPVELQEKMREKFGV